MKNQYTIILFAFFLFLASSCQQEKKATSQSETTESLSEATVNEYKKKGKEIAQASFETLSGQLKTALEEGGVPKAIELCNVSAYPTIDGLSKKYNAKIRRTSLKIRNPKDNPTKKELVILQQYEKDYASGKKLSPIVDELDNKNLAFYAPVIVKDACLQCHGIIGETMSAENHEIVKNIYPKDQATGYAAGDLRGIWSIEFIN